MNASACFAHPVFLVALGSAVGGVGRYLLGRLVADQSWVAGLPWGTFFINVLGSFLVGFFAICFPPLSGGAASKRLFLLLGTGLCGGFTTFSTFELETFRLLEEGRWAAALGYVTGSVVCGLTGAALGVGLGAWLTRCLVRP